MSEADARSRTGGQESPWTDPIIDLLRDWDRRADSSTSINYSIAQRLSRFNVALGIPVVVFATFAGTSIFATLGETGIVGFKIFVGVISVLAAVLASLQTFLRFAERAEQHRVAATRWAAIRREIDEMVALHPVYPESRGDPKEYLDQLRDRIDKLTAESPQMGERVWGRRLASAVERATAGTTGPVNNGLDRQAP